MSKISEAVAQRVISAAESAPASRPMTPASSNAHEYPEIADQEAEHYLSNGDRSSITRQVASKMVTTLDERPFVTTKHGQVRRAFDDRPGSKGNDTRRFIREQVDKQTAGRDLGRKLRDIVKANPKQFGGISHTDPIEVIGEAIFGKQKGAK